MASTSDGLFAAIEAGDVARVRAMVDDDPSLASARDAEGVSALMRARYRLDRGMIEALQSRVTQMDLFESAAAGDLDRLTELLAYDPASIDGRSADGFTALHFAAFFGRPDAARLLVNHAADVDARGTGWMIGTPLHSAASGSHAEVVGVLLERAPIRTRGSRVGGRRCTRRHEPATSRASPCSSPRAPTRKPRTTRARACSRWRRGAATCPRPRRSRPPDRSLRRRP